MNFNNTKHENKSRRKAFRYHPFEVILQELFISKSNDSINWSDPIRISPENFQNKADAKLIANLDGSFTIVYNTR